MGMNELTLGGKVYVSSKRAAEITGYAKDYIGQLCREGRVQAQLVGRNWYILESAIREHRFGDEESAQKGDKDIKNTRAASNLGWESPRYAPEVPKMIPIAQVQSKIDSVLSKAAEDDVAKEKEKRNWGDVQSAWQEWFSLKQEEAPKEPEVETQTVVIEDTEAEQVAITTVYERGEVLDLSQVKEGTVEEEIVEREEVVEERSELEINKVKRGSSSMIRAILIIISIIVIFIALIGAGIAAKYYPGLQSRIPQLNILQGITVINK